MRDQLEIMTKAGLEQAECVGMTDVRTSDYTRGALFRAMVE